METILNNEEAHNTLSRYWNDRSWDEFKKFIETPNLSPAFEKKDNTSYTRNAAVLVMKYIKSLNLKGCSVILYEDNGLSPFLYVTIEASETRNCSQNIGFYAHIDKQPPLHGEWKDGLNAYTLVKDGDKVYGRGTVDDGYALFLIPNLVKTLQDHNVQHDKYTFLFECSEESGSCHLEHYLKKLKNKLKSLDYLICMDSGGPTDDRLWFTSSLRGCFMGELEVSIGKHGHHSGDAGGIVPSPFRILTNLINRVENSMGTMRVLKTELDEKNLVDAVKTAHLLGKEGMTRFEVEEGLTYSPDDMTNEEVYLYLKNTWKPSLTVIGLDGLPSVADGGNFIHPTLKCKLSVRLPPNLDAEEAKNIMKEEFESNPPFNARVEFTPTLSCNGWMAPDMGYEFNSFIKNASLKYYGKESGYVSCGGSIPIMSLLSEMLPDTKIMATGVLTSESNAHAPNEVLDLKILDQFSKSMYDLLCYWSQ